VFLCELKLSSLKVQVQNPILGHDGLLCNILMLFASIRFFVYEVNTWFGVVFI